MGERGKFRGEGIHGKAFTERRGRPDSKPAMIRCSEVTGRICHCSLLTASQRTYAWRRKETLRSKNRT